MIKEELEKEAMTEYKKGSYPQIHPDHWAFLHGYLAGAEPREKRIEELEATNKKISNECHKLVDSLEKKQKVIAELEKEKCELLGIIQGKDEAIKDLEWQLQEVAKDNDNYQKENAELKKESDFYHKEKGEYKGAFLKQVVKTNKINRQLTKAKELLKWALHSDPEHDEDFDQKWNEAEQFLSEVEK